MTSQPADPTLIRQQREFATVVRTGESADIPGVAPARLAVYQELVESNISALLAANFPVIRKTLAEDDWQALIRDFIREHHARTPLFTAIGEEFIRHLDARSDAGDPPWLVELAHWEWLELAAQIAPSATGFDTHGDVLHGIPVIDPGVQIAAYAWPVHRIGPAWRPDAAPSQPTLLMARRDSEGRVHFSELSPLLYRMLDWLEDDDPPSSDQLIQRLCDEAAPVDEEAFHHEARAMLRRLRDEGVVVGIRVEKAV